jgi:hypothetical protein
MAEHGNQTAGVEMDRSQEQVVVMFSGGTDSMLAAAMGVVEHLALRAVRGQLGLLFVATVILSGLAGCTTEPSSEPPAVITRASSTASLSASGPAPLSGEAATPPPFPTPALLPAETASPATSNSATMPGGVETPSPGSAEATGFIRLAIGISSPESVAIFNKVATEQDVIAARLPYVDLLGEVKTGQKMLVLGPGDEEAFELESLIAEVKAKGVSILGYNLETALPEGELVDREARMQRLASEGELLYVFGPTLGKLMKHYDSFARHADVLLLQSQRFQAAADYEGQTEALIEKIRAANPGVQVWVQVSVSPPEKGNLTAEQVVHDIQLVADKADLIWVFFSPKTISTMEEVLMQMRQ